MADPIFDDLFLGCAFAAYVELAIQCGGVPDQDTTRQLAYRYYEEELSKCSTSDETRNPLCRLRQSAGA